MNVELLKKLCAVRGASGQETEIGEVILAEIKDYIDDHSVDAMGNLIAHKKGLDKNAKKMMLAGHMDQIGLMVTFIDKKGFLRFTNIGGKSPAICYGQRFIFPNGTIAVAYSERLKDPKELSLDKMYLDVGAKDKEAAEKLVKIGDIAVFSAEPVVSGDVFISPALDDRVGCFIMIEALKKIKNPAYDLYFVFTSQEEVGLRGAKTSAYAIDPDYGLSFDVTISADTPKAHKYPSKMYGGAAIKIKDASLICHPTMVKHLEDCAKAANVPYQFEILDAGGTDSGAIHLTKGGVPSGVISVATRYIHSANEMCAISDVEACIDLTVKALQVAI